MKSILSNSLIFIILYLLPTLLFIDCVSLKAFLSSASVYDPGVKIRNIKESIIPMHLEYYTKSFLDSLSSDQLLSIDSSFSSNVNVHGIALITSDESQPSCRDIRTDKLSAFKVVGDDTIAINFSATKFLRNSKEGWGRQSDWADDNTSGPVCTFTKVLKLSLYDKPSDTFFVSLETEIPTSGKPDSYRYLWSVIIEPTASGR